MGLLEEHFFLAPQNTKDVILVCKWIAEITAEVSEAQQ